MHAVFIDERKLAKSREDVNLFVLIAPLANTHEIITVMKFKSSTDMI